MKNGSEKSSITTALVQVQYAIENKHLQSGQMARQDIENDPFGISYVGASSAILWLLTEYWVQPRIA
jgi:hypothetical protein